MGVLAQLCDCSGQVAQGAVFSRVVFSIYSEPICDITNKYDIQVNKHAEEFKTIAKEYITS